MNSSIQTLLLDLDGTLIDSRADLTAAVNHVLERLGHPLQTQTQVVPRIGNGLRQLLRDTIGLTDTAELADAKSLFDEYYADHCVDQTVLYEHVEDCLNDFSDVLKVGIVTNKPQEYAEKILDHLGVLSLIDVVIGGDALPEAKPSPMPVLEAIKKLNGKHSSALMVGDGHQDIRAGKSAGVRTCVVKYGFGFHSDLLELGPDHVINNFKEIKEIVK